METVIMHPKNDEQLSALKAFAKALKVKYETSPYDPAFVSKIKASTKEVNEGKFITLDPSRSIWDNIK